MKQVPEGTKVNRKQQLQLLRAKITGNQAFGACRGKFGQPIGQLTADWIKNSESPTQVLGQWDSFTGQARVMTNLLAQFRRDGMNIAHRELLKALNDSDYLLPGEKLPIEATRPITVLMLEPEKTLTFLRWLLESHWSSLRNYLAWKESQYAKAPNELTEKLYTQFLMLEELAREHAKHPVEGFFEGKELCEAYATIASSFDPAILKNAMCGMGLNWGQWNDHIEGIRHLAFLYMFDCEQSKVLKRFSRKDQKRIATWQINVPKTHTLSAFGLYPEQWRVRDSANLLRSVSRGSSHGYKVVCCTMERKMQSWFPTASQGQAEAGKYGMLFT